jgi:FkbM family methyltransferase
MNGFSSLSRNILRWYLRKFPLRDGKTFFYQRFSPRLTPSEPFVTAALDAGFSMKLDLRDAVQRRMYFYGDYDERYEAKMIRRLLDKGEIFWDIGANIGYFSLLAAATLQHSGQVISFEPGQVAYARLMDNIGLNPFRNIATFNLAVTDREGEAALHLAAETADGCASLYGAGPEVTAQEICRTVSLDGFAQSHGLPGPDFIKIDVEGAELFVLRGAREMLAVSRPLLLVELKAETLAASGTDKREVQELLAGYGYVPSFPYKRKWYRARDVSEVKSRNLLWFDPEVKAHREKTARLPIIDAR